MCGLAHPIFDGYEGEVLKLNGDMPLYDLIR